MLISLILELHKLTHTLFLEFHANSLRYFWDIKSQKLRRNNDFKDSKLAAKNTFKLFMFGKSLRIFVNGDSLNAIKRENVENSFLP